MNRSRLAISAYYFCMGMTFASWASRIPDIKSALQLTDGALGLLLFAIPAGQLVMMPVSPRIIGRIGSCTTVRIALRLYFAVLLAIALAPTFLSLFITLFFFGVASNMVNISVNAQACVLEDDYGRPIMSSFHGMWSLGALAGGLVGVLFAALSSVPLLCHYLAVVALGMVLSCLGEPSLLRRDLKVAPKDTSEKGKSKFARLDFAIIMVGLVAFGGMFCEGTIFDWSGVYFSTVVRPQPWLVRAGYIAGIAAMTAGRFLGDSCVLRWGAVAVLRACGCCIVAGLALATALPYLLPATLGFLLVGAGISAVVPLCYSAAGHCGRFSPAAAIAIVSSISFFGFLVGPPLIGLLADATSLRAALAVAGSFGLIITAFASSARRH